MFKFEKKNLGILMFIDVFIKIGLRAARNIKKAFLYNLYVFWYEKLAFLVAPLIKVVDSKCCNQQESC